MRSVSAESIARCRNNFGVLCDFVVQGPHVASGHDFSRAVNAQNIVGFGAWRLLFWEFARLAEIPQNKSDVQ
jgi:hypothetical protein